ncbi:MAG: hypothetical protein ACQEVA_07565 [Myxococcota bacterium]
MATTGCLGGDGGGNNGNNGDSCASGEIEYNGQCYNECSSADDCNAGESCTPIGDSDDSVCIQTSDEDTGTDTGGETDTGTDDDGGGTADGTCSDILECAQTCQDQTCLDNCTSEGTADAQQKFDAFLQCNQGGGNCDAELAACLGCSESETVIGLDCVASCSANGDCESDEICDEPILQPGESVCSYDVSTLGDGCAESTDCEGPDSDEVVQGQGFCSTEDADGNEIPGGICYAVGCNTNGQQVAYGPTTGCGLDAFCLAQPDGQGGTIGLCLPLCRETADCPRGLEDGYTCSIFQKDDSGNLGTCDAACETDADCESTDQQGNTVAGRCNTTEGYCEQPCDPAAASDCTDAGGTCEEDGENAYCVF